MLMKKLLTLLCIAALMVSLISACGGSGGSQSPTTAPAQGTTDTSSGTSSGTSTSPADTTPAGNEELGVNTFATNPILGDLVIDRNMGGRTITFLSSGDRAWVEPNADSETYEREIEYRSALEDAFGFKFNYLGIPSDEFNATVTTSIMAGLPVADMISFGTDWVLPFILQDLLQPLNKLSFNVVGHPLNDVSVSEAMTWKGDVYGVALGTGSINWNMSCVAFNKRIAADLGVDLFKLRDSGDWTWDEFYRLASLATIDTDNDGNNDQFGLIADEKFYAIYIASTTGKRVIDDNNRLHYNDPDIMRAIEWVASTRPFWYSPPENANWDYYITEFTAGRVLFSPACEMWHTGNFQGMPDGFGILPMPVPAKGATYTAAVLNNGGWCIPTGVNAPEDVALIYSLISGYRPWEVDENGEPFEDPLMMQLGGMVEDEESLLSWYMIHDGVIIGDKQKNFDVFWTSPGWNDYFQNVWRGDMTAQQSAEVMQPAVQAVIDSKLAEWEAAAGN
jgi:multiple sugar transport system substrate-binding protein